MIKEIPMPIGIGISMDGTTLIITTDMGMFYSSISKLKRKQWNVLKKICNGIDGVLIEEELKKYEEKERCQLGMPLSEGVKNVKI